MNVLFSGDKGASDGILMSTLSLCEKCERVNIYILTSFYRMEGIEEDFALFLDKKAKEKNPENSVQLFDITKLFESRYPEKNKNTRFTAACMLRLFADLVTELPDKILYLDADVLCLKEPSAVFETPMEDAEIAGVLDRYGKYFFMKFPCKLHYVNSGVLLLNLDEIRRTGLFERCRVRCSNRRMFMPDQSALNREARKKVLLPRRYNEQKKSRADTVFRHFTTFFVFFPFFKSVTVKPWQIDKMHLVLKNHDHDLLYEEFIRAKTEYQEGVTI